jgi:Zinc knuckle
VKSDAENTCKMETREKIFIKQFVGEGFDYWKSSGAKSGENEVISYLTINLLESYDPLVTALDNLTLEVVKTGLLTEEDKRLVRDGINSGAESDQEAALIRDRINSEAKGDQEAALIVKSRRLVNVSKLECFNCGEKGHYANNCPDKKERLV